MPTPNDKKKNAIITDLSLMLDTEWSIKHSKFEEIEAFFLKRVNEGPSVLTKEELELITARTVSQSDYYSDLSRTEDGIAMIPVEGVLAKKLNLISAFSGGTSYGILRRDIELALQDDTIKAIMLCIDSPGGAVKGCQDLATFIQSVRGQKPIATFSDGTIASAAYWIGCSADRMFLTPSAEAGSIGVNYTHYDYSERDKKNGVKRTHIFAGKYKMVGADNEPLSQEHTAVIQNNVDTFYKLFVDGVASARGMSVEDVLKMADGRVFVGAKAKEIGLVDEVGTKESAINWLREQIGSKQTSSTTASTGITDDDEGGIEAMDLKELKEKHPELVAQIEKETSAKAEASFQVQMDGVSKELKDLRTENKILNKKVELMEEKDIQAEASAIWTSALTGSKIPARRHESIKKQVSIDDHMKDGKFNTESFAAAVGAEVQDWEKDFSGTSSTSVLGLGTASRTVTDSDVDLNDEDREPTAEEKALIERNLKVVGASTKK